MLSSYSFVPGFFHESIIPWNVKSTLKLAFKGAFWWENWVISYGKRGEAGPALILWFSVILYSTSVASSLNCRTHDTEASRGVQRFWAVRTEGFVLDAQARTLRYISLIKQAKHSGCFKVNSDILLLTRHPCDIQKNLFWNAKCFSFALFRIFWNSGSSRTESKKKSVSIKG